MAVIPQQDQFEVESLSRQYLRDGTFSESFKTMTIIAIVSNGDLIAGEIDMNGPVPLPANIPITFDCSTRGINVTNIEITVGRADVILVYWTKYRGNVWSRMS